MDISRYKKAITDQEQIRERLRTSYELGRRSDILNDFLNGTRHLDEELTAYVRNLRLNFGHALFCCGIYIACKAGNADNLQGLKDEFINNIHGLQGCIAWSCRGHIGVVCQTLHYTGSHQISRRKLAEEIYALIAREQPDIVIHIGIGEIQKGLKGFHKSFQQAWDAAEAAQRDLTFGKNIVYFQELGVFQLLLNQAGKERAADFTRITIQKLIQYDCKKGTDYLDTLEVILQSANLKEAAETLFLHHNTVIFRKRRIEEILGQSITDFEAKLSLALAIKFYRMSENKM
jgi:sugar diacid utilization regulator